MSVGNGANQPVVAHIHDELHARCLVLDDGKTRLEIFCVARVVARTGVEMEALTGAAVAALTVIDMVKSVDRAARVAELCLLEKSGGKSGSWRRG